MKKKIKTLWVKALRSEKYKQARGTLKNNKDGFCCLGVLCDLHRKAKKRKRSFWKKRTVATYSYNGHYGTLPKEVQEWAGLTNEIPYVLEGESPRNLAVCNDIHRYSFKKIADLIEKSL